MTAGVPTEMRVNYIVLARGGSLEAARVLAVSADQRLVAHFVLDYLLAEDDAESLRDEAERPEPLHVIPGGEATER
jgi:hypothetical protein